MARILIVDDQPAILAMLESLLVQQGHIVTSATDSFDAMEKCKDQTFEMVVTDVTMPGGPNGFDLVRTLRADPRLSKIPIIMLTGKREKRDIEKGVEVGVDDYCIKPLDPDIFLAKVDSMFSKKGTNQTAFQETPVSSEGKFNHVVRVMGVSEVGLSFESAQPFHPGSKIKIDCSFFDDLGVECPVLRVVSSTPKGNHFQITVAYIGVGEKFLQPFRVWRNRQKAA